MSNNKNNREQDKLIDMHDNQMNPGLAKSEDFKVVSPAEAARMPIPGHGQCGKTEVEYHRLENEADSDGKSKLGSPRPERNDVNNRTPKARINAANAPHEQE